MPRTCISKCIHYIAAFGSLVNFSIAHASVNPISIPRSISFRVRYSSQIPIFVPAMRCPLRDGKTLPLPRTYSFSCHDARHLFACSSSCPFLACAVLDSLSHTPAPEHSAYDVSLSVELKASANQTFPTGHTCLHI